MSEYAELARDRGVRRASVLAWLRLARVYQKLQRAASGHLRAWNLSMAQFDALAQTGSREGLTQQELADRLLVTKGNISQLLDRMEQAGLIRRQQEGRTCRIHLTEPGRQLFAEVVPRHEAFIAGLFDAVPCREQHQLLAHLRTLDHALDG